MGDNKYYGIGEVCGGINGGVGGAVVGKRASGRK